MKKIKAALFGLGRIGEIHLNNIILNKKYDLKYIYDPDNKKLNFFKNKYKIDSPNNIKEEILENNSIEAIFIATPTANHLEMILKCIKYKKNIFCEKPLDLNYNRLKKHKKLFNNYKKVLQVGFHKRFDDSTANLIELVKKKKIGNIEKVIITSRDKEPPSLNYLKKSGGILRDCTIHDIDIMRQIFGNDKIKNVFCYGSNLYSKNTKRIRDFDTIVSIFKTEKNKIAIINNSRHSNYGYDQRIEVFGYKGMLQTKNMNNNNLLRYGTQGVNIETKFKSFFLERYEKSFEKEIDNFATNVINKRKSKVSFSDCTKALEICEYLYKSLKTKKSENIKQN